MADVHPVFAMDKITGKPMLIGTTYLSSLTERENQKDVIWFNDDVPDYNQYPITYELGLNKCISNGILLCDKSGIFLWKLYHLF